VSGFDLVSFFNRRIGFFRDSQISISAQKSNGRELSINRSPIMKGIDAPSSLRLSPFPKCPFAVTFSLLLASAASICEQGLGYYWNGALARIAHVALEYCADLSGSYIPEFRGSFIARVSEHHKFKIWCNPFESATLWPVKPESIFTFDNVFRVQGQDDQFWEEDLVKDFRYQISQRIHDNYRYVKQSLAVEFPGRGMADLNGDLIETCEESGCRNLALSRDPYACQPAPTPSPSSSLAFAPSPSIRPSKSPPPSDAFSRSRGFDQSAGPGQRRRFPPRASPPHPRGAPMARLAGR
jgi:hypothetical protein